MYLFVFNYYYFFYGIFCSLLVRRSVRVSGLGCFVSYSIIANAFVPRFACSLHLPNFLTRLTQLLCIYLCSIIFFFIYTDWTSCVFLILCVASLTTACPPLAFLPGSWFDRLFSTAVRLGRLVRASAYTVASHQFCFLLNDKKEIGKKILPCGDRWVPVDQSRSVPNVADALLYTHQSDALLYARSLVCPQGITAGGQVYWFNVQTRKSQWHAPPSAVCSLPPPPPPPPPRQRKSAQQVALQKEVVAKSATHASTSSTDAPLHVSASSGIASLLADAKKSSKCTHCKVLTWQTLRYTSVHYIAAEISARKKRKRMDADKKSIVESLFTKWSSLLSQLRDWCCLCPMP